MEILHVIIISIRQYVNDRGKGFDYTIKLSRQLHVISIFLDLSSI